MEKGWAIGLEKRNRTWEIAMHSIEIMDLTKRYGKVCAVDHVSLDVKEGEVLGLLGLNGAGKSTTLYMLAGLVRPTSGSISMFGLDLRRHFLEIVHRIGYLVERPAFYDYLSVRENLALCARLAGRRAEIDRTLEQVDLLYAARKKARALSTGMRQRLGLAQALLFNPDLLILDEPTSGLDPEATRDLLTLLRTLTRENQITLVFSSHMLHEVEELCDRVAIINQGRLVACERMDHLLHYEWSTVDVLVDAPERVVAGVRAQVWVSSAQVSNGKLEVVLADAPVHRLTTYLVHEGCEVNGVIPRRGTLQEYFLKVLKQ